MTFEDLPAAVGLEIAKGEVARRGMSIDKITAEQIKNKFYLDDGALAANSREELKAMRGSRTLEG